MNEPPTVLRRHVEAFNEGVRSGDFARMVAGFSDDAEMSFQGVPAGPFVGREAIADAYREQPPDDEIEVLDTREHGGTIEAVYAWRREPDAPAGRLVVIASDALIRRLVITFEPGATLNG